MVLNPVETKRKVLVIECEVWSRVVGYLRPVERYNAGKKHEFENRKFLDKKKEDNMVGSRNEKQFCKSEKDLKSQEKSDINKEKD